MKLNGFWDPVVSLPMSWGSVGFLGLAAPAAALDMVERELRGLVA